MLWSQVYVILQLQSSPIEAENFLDSGSGATQRLIDDCTTKTRFIKVSYRHKLLNSSLNSTLYR